MLWNQKNIKQESKMIANWVLIHKHKIEGIACREFSVSYVFLTSFKVKALYFSHDKKR